VLARKRKAEQVDVEDLRRYLMDEKRSVQGSLVFEEFGVDGQGRREELMETD
jgi:hypothetical protein